MFAFCAVTEILMKLMEQISYCFEFYSQISRTYLGRKEH